MTFGYGKYNRLGKQKLSENVKYLGGAYPGFTPSITGTGAGTTSATPGNGYTYQTYTSSGTLEISSPQVVDILVVGGGGAGGATGPGVSPSPYYVYSGGGGGAGGVVYVPNFTLTSGTYTIAVGSGAGAASSVSGNPSYILTGAGTTLIVAGGGGCASGYLNYSAQPGGSGGGTGSNPFTAYSRTAGTATQPTQSQPLITSPYNSHGFPGGSAPVPYASNAGFGGGGAAAIGGGAYPVAPSFIYGGAGGIGIAYTEFTGALIGSPKLSVFAGYWGGGGSGGSYSGGSPGSAVNQPGGVGGGGTGGNGGYYAPGYIPAFFGGSPGTPGSQNTGGGGGGGSYATNSNPPYGAPILTNGGSGGSGIVVIRWRVSP